ncbi:hypothetical protein ABPD29_00585 [Secundilactobacillus paracollinoides]|uniref:hypothetical protein n=1 Tax=Secundilactobacillus paracollinoides TaxID=240427 RepID=UPI0012EA248F
MRKKIAMPNVCSYNEGNTKRGDQMADNNHIVIQLPKTIDMNQIAAILETAFESNGIESYHVTYQQEK